MESIMEFQLRLSDQTIIYWVRKEKKLKRIQLIFIETTTTLRTDEK